MHTSVTITHSSQNNQDEHTLRSLSTSQVCLSWGFWCTQSNSPETHFLAILEVFLRGRKKAEKWRKIDILTRKTTSTHTTKTFLSIKFVIQSHSIISKINKTQQVPKNTKKWRFLTPFRRPPKTAIFSPFLRVPKNDDFFVINDVQRQNFSSKSRLRKKSGTSVLGRGRGGSPLIFSWKSSRWYL
jgi:hypothetical protein